jgi:hypothetical protein
MAFAQSELKRMESEGEENWIPKKWIDPTRNTGKTAQLPENGTSLIINELRSHRKMQEGEFDLNPFAVIDEAARLLPPVQRSPAVEIDLQWPPAAPPV